MEDICIELLQKCPHNCVYCSSNSTISSTEELSISEVKQILDFAMQKKAKNISLSGGEPLYYKDLDKILNYISTLNYTGNFYLYTSGNYTDEQFQVIRDNIDRSNLVLVFNYQSCYLQEFIEISGTDTKTYYRVNENIKSAVNEGFSVEVNTVPNLINIYSLEDIYHHIKELGVSKINFLRFIPQGRGAKNRDIFDIGPNYDEVLKIIIDKIKFCALFDDVKIRCGIPFSGIDSDFTHKCKAGFNKLVFNFTGNVYPCEAFKGCKDNRDYILGNIRTDSIPEIHKNGIKHDKLKGLRKVLQV